MWRLAYVEGPAPEHTQKGLEATTSGYPETNTPILFHSQGYMSKGALVTLTFVTRAAVNPLFFFFLELMEVKRSK